MDHKFTELFERWHIYVQKLNKVFERLAVLLMDLGIPQGDVRIIAFISSAWRGELKFYDSTGISSNSQKYLQTVDPALAEEQLIDFFQIRKEHSIFSFDSRSAQIKAYDEFGIIHQGYEDTCVYGIVIQYHQLKYSKIIFELINQISLYCRNVLDNEKFEIEEYMLENIIYVALKKQINVDFYNTLASSHYEKKVASGKILLIDAMQQCKLKIHFNEKYPLDIKNVKQIRKLLEMTADKLFLVSQNGHAIGIGDYGNFSGNFELFVFNGHQRWSYYNNDQELLSYKEGKYTFVFDYNINFISDFPDNFISVSNYDYLNSIIHEIRQHNYGTLLIITNEAQNEVERLCMLGRGYSIQPVDLKLPGNRDLLASLTSIDGAVFIDTNFLCYGVGVILDGIAVKTGLNARGARYNSAQCYIDNKDYEKFAAVVVSDDETVDIIYNKR